MAELLATSATHNFSKEELERYIVEGSAEIGKFLPEDSVALIKSATATKKSFSFKLNGIKVKTTQLRPKVALFIACVQAQALTDNIGYALVKADVCDLCNTIRKNWERKDEEAAKEKENAPAAA